MQSLKLEISFKSIPARLYENDGDILVFTITGSGSSLDLFEPISSGLARASGQSVLTMEYSGQPSLSDVYSYKPAQHFLEVIEAFDSLCAQYPNKKIVVFGTSYGALHATQLAKYRTFHKLVLAAPAIYPPDSFYTTRSQQDAAAIDESRNNTDLLNAHPLLVRKKLFKGSTLVVVHGNDASIPPATTDAYTKHLGADVLHFDLPHSIEGSGQTDETIAHYCKEIADWINL